VQEYQSKLSEWGQWFAGFISSSDEVVDAHDIAEVDLRCSLGLIENIDHLYRDCLGLIGEWSTQLVDYTNNNYRLFESEPESFENSHEMYQAIAMVQFVQTALRVHYNMEFAEGEYNAIDSRNLFLTGVLTGHGGTCVTLPVLYAALGQRVGYPIAVASNWEHFYCVWGEGPNSFCLEAAGNGFEDRLAPHIQQFSIHHALTHYTRQLFYLLGGVPSLAMFAALEAFETDSTSQLAGPDAQRFRSAAIQNLKRILKNRFPESAKPAESTHDKVFAELFNL